MMEWRQFCLDGGPLGMKVTMKTGSDILPFFYYAKGFHTAVGIQKLNWDDLLQ